jgi:hypothetical protein
MRNEMKTLLAAAAFAVAGVATAQAADLTPMTGHWTKLGADCSALVDYIPEPDGFHVAVNIRLGPSEKTTVARFETVLAAGQSAAVSIRRGAGRVQQRRRPLAHRRTKCRRFRLVTSALGPEKAGDVVCPLPGFSNRRRLIKRVAEAQMRLEGKTPSSLALYDPRRSSYGQ